MKLSKGEINKISKLYSLGDVSSVKLIKAGNINHNFIFNTSKGSFIVRFLGSEFNLEWKDKIDLEIRVLNYLKESNFEYEFPKIMNNSSGQYLTKLGSHTVYVYPRIKGRTLRKLDRGHVKQIARALASFHKLMLGFQVPMRYKKVRNCKKILRELKKMSGIHPKNDLDRLMLDNINDYIKTMENLNYELESDKFVICHSDFHRGNMLFRDGRFVGMIDFEYLEYGNKIKDFLFNEVDFKGGILFIKEYLKYDRLTKKELRVFVSEKLIHNADALRWVYGEPIKNESDRLKKMKKIINKRKRILEFGDLLKKEFDL